jgi:hypothetical protein
LVSNGLKRGIINYLFTFKEESMMKFLKHFQNGLLAIILIGIAQFTYGATDCNQVTEIPVSECQSLLELYNSTDGANWIAKEGWNETNTPCNWYGIDCSNVCSCTCKSCICNIIVV